MFGVILFPIPCRNSISPVELFYMRQSQESVFSDEAVPPPVTIETVLTVLNPESEAAHWEATKETSASPEINAVTERVHKALEQSAEIELERQFAESHFLTLEKEQLEYALVAPVPTPPEGTPKEWTVFIGGFSAVKDVYKQEMFDLARFGQHVLFLAPNKGITPTTEDTDYYNVRAGALPDTIRNKASAVALLLEQLQITNANIIGHSQGGAVATALTGARPAIAKRLILDNPAGLIGVDSVGKLLGRVADEARVENPGAQSGAMWIKQIKQLVRIPLFRATKEIPGIARTDIRPILANLKHLVAEGSARPEIILINSNNDQVFPKEDVEAGIGGSPFESYIDRWVMYADKNAGHGKFDREESGLYPELMDEPPMRTSVIHQILTEGELRRGRNATG